MKSVNEFVNKLRMFILTTAHKHEHNWDFYTNERGNLIYRANMHDSRYSIDFADDFHAEGWLQFDTSQDAEYFGFWVNPTTRTTLTYCEGDWTIVDCPTIENYNAEIADACRVYLPGFIAKSIDMDGSMTIYQQERGEFFIPVLEGSAS